MTNRPTGTIAYLLNAEMIAHDVKHRLSATAQPLPCDSSACRIDILKQFTPFATALVFGTDKRWALVNTEGVGNFADDYDAKASIYSWLQGGDNTALTPLGFDQVQSALTGESMDLSEFIRTFGNRLDSNHWGWHNWAMAEANA